MVETKAVEVGERNVRVSVDGDDVSAEFEEPVVEFESCTGGSVSLTSMDGIGIEPYTSRGRGNVFVVLFNDDQRAASSEYTGNDNSGEYDRNWKFETMNRL